MSGTADNLLGGRSSLPISAPQVVNPLDAINAGNQAASNYYDLQQKRARQAAGQAFLDSIDPNTGQPNQSLLMQNLKTAGPAVAMAAQDTAQKGVTLDANTYDLHMARLGNLARTQSQLLADYPHGVPPDVVNATIDRTLQNGGITAAEAATARQQFGNDPVKNAQIIAQNVARNLSTQEALTAVRPPTSSVNVGPGVVGTAGTPPLSTTGTQGAIGAVGAVTPVAPSTTEMLRIEKIGTNADGSGRDGHAPAGD